MAKFVQLLISFMVVTFINIEYGLGWGLFKATYHVIIGNGLNDNLWVHCKSGDSDLKLQKLPKNGNFSWDVKAGWSVGVQRLYFCGLTWLRHLDTEIENVPISASAPPPPWACGPRRAPRAHRRRSPAS